MSMKGFRVFLISVLIVMITVDVPNFFMLFSAVAQEENKSEPSVANQTQSRGQSLPKSETVSPKNFTLVPEKEPPKLTPEQLRVLNSSEDDEIPESPPPLTNTNISGPPERSETKVPSNQTESNQTNASITAVGYKFDGKFFHRVAAGDAHVYLDQYVGSHGSVVTEPSTANKGRLVFYSGNWFTARSTNGGTLWTYNNPFTGMADFCCDQDVIYDANRQIFIWYRQAVRDSNGENYFRLAISRDTLSWWYYDIRPTLFSSTWNNQWWDYPHLALSNNYLFLTSNVFNGLSGMTSPTRAVLAKVSLDDLSNARTIFFLYLEHPFESQGRRTVTPVQGATNTMYFGTHLSNDRMRIYKWPESSNIIFWYDRNIPAWTPSARGSMHCAGPDGYNSCAFSDNRILGGWVRGEKVGFLWNVGEGAHFPYPYINSAVFLTSSMTYAERPLVWNDVNAWMYGHTSPNKRGLGLVAFWAGGSYNPSVGAAIADNFVVPPPGWQMNWIAGGTNSPARERLGDYLRIRAFGGQCALWVGTAYVLVNGSGPTSSVPSDVVFPYYFILGREVDGTPEACYGGSKVNDSTNFPPADSETVELHLNDFKQTKPFS
jgi:hypothetical protein